MNILNQIMSISLVRRHQNVVDALLKEVSTICTRKKHIFKMWRFKVSWDLKHAMDTDLPCKQKQVVP